MPLLRVRRDAVVGELAHLLADRVERIVEPAGADRRIVMLPDQLDEAGAARRGVAGGDEMLDGGRHARRDRGRRQPEIGQAHDLALAHRNAADHLGEIFAGADAHQEFLDLAEIAGRRQPQRISLKLPDGLDIGRKPSKPVRGALFAIEYARNRAAFDRHPVGDGAARIVKQSFDGCHRLA